jgi:hypothetical protein
MRKYLIPHPTDRMFHYGRAFIVSKLYSTFDGSYGQIISKREVCDDCEGGEHFVVQINSGENNRCITCISPKNMMLLSFHGMAI